ncbi:MAG: class I SAM-dependent methyltransferase [Bacteroidia bacterium]
MKLRLFEFEDLPWFPTTIRQGMTDYLRFVFNTANLYEPVTGILVDSLEKSSSAAVIDLCSGGGGTIEKIQQNIKQYYKKDIHFVLTDKFPNKPAFKLLHEKTNGRIFYSDQSIDATAVPGHIKGFRTIFSGFHHFDKQTALLVIKDAVNSNEGIAVFDGGDKNLKIILAIVLGHPLIFFFCTPFFKPFRLSRFLFTYLLPVIPLCTIWDGIVSITRLYKPSELTQLAKEAGPCYHWNSGKVKNRFGMNITYLIGYPSANKS